jgi:4-amino-4-deoxy-L-arabinose transferase-like glycosyltransferase
MTTTAVRPSTRRDPLLTGTRVLLGAFGAFKLAGTAYFLFFATAEQGGDPEGLLDWSVGIWSTVLASALVVAAVQLRRGDRRMVRVVNGLLLVEIAFSMVKLFVYDEPESIGFMAVDLVILGLLALISRRRAS